jgi:hypothetical protein
MKRKRTTFDPEAPTIAETLRFIEHEASKMLARTNIDWNRQKAYPDVSISSGCPHYWIMPYLYSPALNNHIGGIFRQIGIVPNIDALGGCFYLDMVSVGKFGQAHKAEILAFLGKDLPADDEPAESFSEPLVDAARETGAGL